MKMPALKKPAAPGVPKIPARKKTPLRTRPSQPPIQIPGIILKQLNGLSARARQISYNEGFLWIGAAVCAILLVQGTLDWLLDLPWHTRFIFALCDLALLGWLAWRYLIKASLKPLTPEEAALKAEIRWPALRTSLISAIQLAKNPEGSRRMVEALVQQVTRRAGQMDFRQAVSGKHLKKLAMTTVVLLAVTAGLFVVLSPKSMVLLRRILLSHEPLPTQTIVIAISHDFSVPAGENIELAAKAQGVIPRSGRVDISYEGKDVQHISINPKSSAPDTFVVALPNVQQGMTYRFYLNDGRGEEFKVVILHGPTLQSVSFEQNYPAYTGLSKIPLTAGNLTLLAGSRLHIEGRADQNLKTARITLKGGGQDIPMSVGDDKKSIAGDIPIPASGLEGFSIIMQNTDGIDSPNNTLYRVEIVPDKPPEITFAPGQPEDKTYVEADHPQLVFKVVDDFQVKQVFLCCEAVTETTAGSDETPQADTTATAPAADVKRIPIDMPAPGAAINFDYVWKTTTESGIWKEGKTISYWIEAVDNNNVTGPGVGKSGKRQWRIITVEEMRKELTEKLATEAEKIDAASQRQQELQKGVGDTIKQGGQK